MPFSRQQMLDKKLQTPLCTFYSLFCHDVCSYTKKKQIAEFVRDALVLSLYAKSSLYDYFNNIWHVFNIASKWR